MSDPTGTNLDVPGANDEAPTAKVLPFRRRPRREHANGSICTDCLMLAANGTEPEHMSTDELADYLERIDEHPNAEYEMTLGHLHDDPAVGCFHAGEPCADGCSCERHEFAWCPCAMCGSLLAGERHDVTFWLDAEEGK
jgi:hypothetical protein